MEKEQPVYKLLHNTINSNIFYILDILNIPHKEKANTKGWLAIICPFHHDKDFGNAYINIDTGVIHCFNCGKKKHISTLLKENDIQLLYAPIQTKNNEKPKQKKTSIIYNFTTKPINENELSFYLQVRGFTETFCKAFGIVYCLTYPYNDYVAIPVIDTKQHINDFEFRKCFEYEYLQKIFPMYKDELLQKLQLYFKRYCQKYNIRFTGGKLYKNDTIWYSSLFEYLLKPKVLYLSNSQVKKTIFNRDNLNYNESLYLCEGTGSIPKLYQYISKNCSCTFGSEVTQQQLNILKHFKEIIIIPDNDPAGYKFVNILHSALSQHTKLFVIALPIEDTHPEYVTYIKNTNKIDSISFLTQHYLHNKIKLLYNE